MLPLKKVLIFTSTNQQKSQKFRFFTGFYRPLNITSAKYEDILAETWIITSNCSYFTTIRRKNVNNELIWNADLVNRLENAFSGKCTGLITSLEQRQYNEVYLVMASQFEGRSVRVVLSESLAIPQGQPPLLTMQNLMRDQHQNREEVLKIHKKKVSEELEHIDELNELNNNVIQRYQMEFDMMKDKFLTILCQPKKIIKRCTRNDNYQDEEIKDHEKKALQLIKLKRQFYRVKTVKPNQNKQEQQPKQVEVEDLFNMTDE